jgi:septum formation protein
MLSGGCRRPPDGFTATPRPGSIGVFGRPMPHPPLILASSSPYRRELLSRLGLPFQAISPDIDESPGPEEAPARLVERLAVAKARAISQRFPEALIIGSDQVVVYGSVIASKPGTHEEAVKQLRAASGKRIVLFTGLALLNSKSGTLQSDVVPYYVTFRSLTEVQIESYLRKEQPYQCAGSVKSEGLGITLIERFEGDDPNALVGLPLIRLIDMLKNEGVDVI